MVVVVVVGAPGATSAAGFFDEAHGVETHAALHGFAHVIEREAAHRGGGQRFHLDAGGPDTAGGGGDREAVVDGDHGDLHIAQRERMTQRDELAGLLRREHTGDLRRHDRFAFVQTTAEQRVARRRCAAQQRRGDRVAGGARLVRDIDHRHRTGVIDVGEAGARHPPTLPRTAAFVERHCRRQEVTSSSPR